jgi:hypothetical protein
MNTTITAQMLAKQYAKNATGLQQMADKARITGKKVGGYTEQQLEAHARRYREMSTRAARCAS